MVNNENENKKDLVVPVEKEINDEIIADYSNEDVLNTKISDEDISILTENEAQIVASKVEVEIEKYENILMNCENQGLSEEEIIAKTINNYKTGNMQNMACCLSFLFYV